MKYLNGENYVEVKDHRYENHPPNFLFNANEIHHNLLKLNVKFKMKLR